MSRKISAGELVGWVGPDNLELTDAGTGWPAHFRVKTRSGLVDAAIYLGPIGLSQRGRDNVERRFQNPGKDRPIVNVSGKLPLLIGLYESDGTRLLIGMEVEKRLDRSTRQSLFMPLHLLRSAGAWGWAEHFSDAGERLIAFVPQLLPIYVELCRTEVSVSAEQIEKVLRASGVVDLEFSSESVERALVTIDRFVREAKFSRDVRTVYGGRCAMCGLDFSLVEGAHIYPVAAPGSVDEVWNGLALCRNHHAAFDSFIVHVEPASLRVNLHADLIAEGKREPGCRAFIEATFPTLAVPTTTVSQPRREMFEKRYEYFGPKYEWASKR